MGQRLRDAEDVSEPALFWRRLRVIELKLSAIVEIFRVHANFPIPTRRTRNVSPPVDRNRQNKAIVVIRVLADDVDAARSREDARRFAITVGKLFAEGDEVDHENQLRPFW